jgi:hypothetical protein
VAAFALGVAGCGGAEATPPQPPPLHGEVAERLAARSEAVAERLEAGDRCAARAEAEALVRDATRAADEGSVPPAYREELLAAANGLVAEIACTPPAVVADDQAERDDGEGRGEREGRPSGRAHRWHAKPPKRTKRAEHGKPRDEKKKGEKQPGPGHGRESAPAATDPAAAA